MWFNAVTLVTALSGAAMQFTGMLGLTEAQAGLASLVLTLVTVFGNSVLRMITSKGIK